MKHTYMALIQRHNSMINILKKKFLLDDKGELWSEVLSESVLICDLALENGISATVFGDGSILFLERVDEDDK